jgi:hypothetical protein
MGAYFKNAMLLGHYLLHKAFLENFECIWRPCYKQEFFLLKKRHISKAKCDIRTKCVTFWWFFAKNIYIAIHHNIGWNLGMTFLWRNYLEFTWVPPLQGNLTCPLPIASCFGWTSTFLLDASYSMFSTNYLLPPTYYFLPFTYYLLLDTHYYIYYLPNSSWIPNFYNIHVTTSPRNALAYSNLLFPLLFLPLPFFQGKNLVLTLLLISIPRPLLLLLSCVWCLILGFPFWHSCCGVHLFVPILPPTVLVGVHPKFIYVNALLPPIIIMLYLNFLWVHCGCEC